MKSVEEIEKNVAAIFGSETEYPFKDFTVEVRPTLRNGKPAVNITVSAMYEAPLYKGPGGLLGLVKAFQEATDCEGVDITDEYSQRGCETCDWGSSYGKVYTVW